MLQEARANQGRHSGSKQPGGSAEKSGVLRGEFTELKTMAKTGGVLSPLSEPAAGRLGLGHRSHGARAGDGAGPPGKMKLMGNFGKSPLCCGPNPPPSTSIAQWKLAVFVASGSGLVAWLRGFPRSM